MTNNTSTEFTYRDEYEAHVSRRRAIMAGRSVSLIAYDACREVYVYDIMK